MIKHQQSIKNQKINNDRGVSIPIPNLCDRNSAASTLKYPSSIIDESKIMTLRSTSTTNGLEDFTIEDDVFEEFNSTCDTNDIDNNDNLNILEWRTNKTHTAFGWLLECLWFGVSIMVLCGIGLSTIAVGITYINLNVFQGHCNLTIVKFISPKNNHIKRYKITAEIVQFFLLNLVHLLCVGLIFTFKFVYQINLVSISIIITVLDSSYRLFNFFYPKDSWMLRNMPSIIISLAIIFLNNTIISRKFFNNRSRQLKNQLLLVFQLTFQFLLSGVIVSVAKLKIFPEFGMIDASSSYIMILFYVLLSFVIRTIARVILLNVSSINHPGTSYILLILCNASTIAVYRFLQAEIQSLWNFVLVSLVIGVIGFLEKITVVFTDHFFIWLYRKLSILTTTTTKQDDKTNSKSFVGKYRTPRSQRFTADVIVCGVIHELTFIGISNALVQLYRNTTASNLSKQFGTRTLVALLCEYVFSIVAVYTMTWFFNIPVLKVWSKRWKKFFMVNLICVISIIVVINLYLLRDWERNLAVSRNVVGEGYIGC